MCIYNEPTAVKKTHKRVTIMVLSVITAFVVSWLPYWVVQMLLIFIDLTMKGLTTFLAFLNYANSAINPILYAFLSETFRKNVDNLLHCSKKNKNNAPAKSQRVFVDDGMVSGRSPRTEKDREDI